MGGQPVMTTDYIKAGTRVYSALYCYISFYALHLHLSQDSTDLTTTIILSRDSNCLTTITLSEHNGLTAIIILSIDNSGLMTHLHT